MPFVRSEGAELAGRYRLVSKLAEGGMGEVWIGEHLVTKRRVALKLLKHGLGEEAARRVIAEARAACAVTHPAIVPVHDVIDDEAGELALVMDLLEGETLEARLARDGRIDATEAAAMLLPIAEALAAAHAKGIVHRDLKPANVFLTSDGEVKLLDFGIVKVVDDAAEGPRTTTGRVMGTPLYMSPEQAFGEGELDSRTDVWSFGLILYEAVTGELPTRGENLGQVLRKLLSIEIAPMRTLDPSVPEAIDAVAREALTRDRDARGVSMDRIADVLADSVPAASARSSSKRARSAPRPAKSSERHDRPVELEGTTPSPMLQGVGASRAGASSSEAAPPSAAAERPRRRGARAAIFALPIVAIAATVTVFVTRRSIESASTTPTAPVPVAAVSGATTASASSFSSGVPMTSFAPVSSRRSDAVDAYQRGLSAYRDGAYGAAVREMDAALALDAGLAAAHLRLSVWQSIGDSPGARRHWSDARRSRDALSARDAKLLDALDDVFRGERLNFTAGAKTLEGGLAGLEGDAELHLYAGIFLYDEDLRASLGHLDAAMEADPGFAGAEQFRSWARGYLGDDVLPALRAAVERFPECSGCLSNLGYLLADRGECVEMVSVARATVAMSPSEAIGYSILASGLVGTGADEGAVLAVLQQKQSAALQQQNIRGSAAGAAIAEDDRITLAQLGGDFAGAGARVDALLRATSAEQDEATRAMSVRRAVEIASETGEVDLAGRLADAWNRTRGGFLQDPQYDDWAMSRDAFPALWVARRRAGKIPASDGRGELDRWLAAWEARTTRTWRPSLWMFAYAVPAESAEDARTALAALDRFGAIPPFHPGTYTDGDIGHVYLLAGKLDEARAYLEKATRGCWFFDAPIAHTRAWLWLGQLREALKDQKGACDAYDVVLSRWGKAKPRSVTADAANERRRALACPK